MTTPDPITDRLTTAAATELENLAYELAMAAHECRVPNDKIAAALMSVAIAWLPEDQRTETAALSLFRGALSGTRLEVTSPANSEDIL